jgi:hypothetical protein
LSLPTAGTFLPVCCSFYEFKYRRIKKYLDGDIYSDQTSDPYGVLWDVVDNGGSDWSVNFSATTNPNFININNWGDFEAFTTGTTTATTFTIEYIRARSPYLLISTGTTATTFNTSVFTISQFEGDINTYSLAPISYVKTKQKLINTQDNIWINLSNLVREDLEADIDYYRDGDYTIARNLSTNESKWVYVNTVNSYNGTGVSTGDTFYFVTDGYIEPNESQGLPNLLLTGEKRYLYRDSNERIYFKTYNLTGATYSTPTSGPNVITFSGDTDMNYGYVKSVKVDIPISENSVTYTFSYSGETPQTITYYIYDECKYRPYDLVFKNKYGMLETLSMSKKSTKILNIENTDYLRSIVDLEGSYNINRHTNKQFNVGGMEEWTLNTEIMPEYMNSVVKEAMLSEEMWLIDYAGVITPVIRINQNLAFKTSLNDKMIQYTIVVKLSHNTVQNIQ